MNDERIAEAVQRGVTLQLRQDVYVSAADAGFISPIVRHHPRPLPVGEGDEARLDPSLSEAGANFEPIFQARQLQEQERGLEPHADCRPAIGRRPKAVHTAEMLSGRLGRTPRMHLLPPLRC